MNDLEQDYIQSLLYYDNPITFTNAYQYMLDAIRAFDIQQEPDKTQDIQDNIIEAYWN